MTAPIERAWKAIRPYRDSAPVVEVTIRPHATGKPLDALAFVDSGAECVFVPHALAHAYDWEPSVQDTVIETLAGSTGPQRTYAVHVSVAGVGSFYAPGR